MHPMIKPALRRGWRDRQTVQFGVAPAHAVVLGPVDTATGSFLSLLDGTRGMPLLRAEAKALGLPADRPAELLARLAGAGLLDDAAVEGVPPPERCDPPADPDRLRADLASLSVVHPEPGAARRRMAARRALRVRVRGAGRVGAAVATALSASGIGQVDVVDGGRVAPWETAPGGLPPESAGERREIAARRAVRAAAPGGGRSRRGPSGAGEPCGPGPGLALTVLTPRDGLDAHAPDPATAEPLLATGTPHLYAGVLEGTGVVGPLVLPGETACAGCLQRHRSEREPTWPRMLAQWRSARGSAAPACDTALATVVAGLAAAHALTFLDGGAPVCAGARLEFALPDLAWECHRLAPHPACGCGASGAVDQPYSPGGVRTPAGPSGPGAEPERRGTPGRHSGVGGAHV
ncbi:TOMM precursor leader peptide-binding protein [Streptomyces zingiberis]|uniref:TOMM leader peptide-binding protein n=1 Tax=Streptomyces zingiberis TaxID=2053010 RepID=A0ABX1BWZ5_9ACTN|nr:TOMM precursor leader peptide-binding protein [Streptomyces zingiberis]NJQ00943.1 TOMM precursor leader peptide-binding protein [Streptomyces zingiberis]